MKIFCIICLILVVIGMIMFIGGIIFSNKGIGIEIAYIGAAIMTLFWGMLIVVLIWKAIERVFL